MSDKDLLRNRFAANLHSYNSLAVVQQQICDELARMISAHIQPEHIARGLEIGTGTGFLTRRLLELCPHTSWTLNDLVEGSAHFLEAYTRNHTIRFQWGDAEILTQFSDKPYDLIATASTVQWFDNLSAFIQALPELLSDKGVIALSTFGPDNFIEIRTTTGDGLDYYTVDELAKLFQQAGLSVLECKEYTRQLAFDSPTAVLRHIKATGVNAIHKSRWTPRRLTQFETDYRTHYSTPTGEVTITYHPILIVATKQTIR